MNEFNIYVGARIRKLRTGLGYSREKLAEYAEMSDKFLYEVEVGRKGLSAFKLHKLAKALGVSTDYIINENQEDDMYERIKVLMHSFSGTEIHCIEEIIRNISKLSKNIQE